MTSNQAIVDPLIILIILCYLCMHNKTYKNGPILALQGHSHGLAIMMFKGAIWTNKPSIIPRLSRGRMIIKSQATPSSVFHERIATPLTVVALRIIGRWHLHKVRRHPCNHTTGTIKANEQSRWHISNMFDIKVSIKFKTNRIHLSFCIEIESTRLQTGTN